MYVFKGTEEGKNATALKGAIRGNCNVMPIINFFVQYKNNQIAL